MHVKYISESVVNKLIEDYVKDITSNVVKVDKNHYLGKLLTGRTDDRDLDDVFDFKNTVFTVKKSL